MSNNYVSFPEVSESNWDTVPEWCKTLLVQLTERKRFLEERVKVLEAHVKELEDRIAKDSHNSSLPPSRDISRITSKRSLRKPSDKKSGGQPGHKGHTLRLVPNPDHTVDLVPEVCDHCGGSLAGGEVEEAEKAERRQVFDLPETPIEVTEFRAPKVRCPNCGHTTKASFPEGVVQPTQYGEKIKAFVTYLQCWQFLPLRRAVELISNLFGCHISEATLLAAKRTCAEAVTDSVEEIKQGLIQARVIGVDETRMYVVGDGHWLHVSSTDLLTYYAHHKKRGNIATDAIGILPNFLGTVEHDGWQPYGKYGCKHALCNVHLLREMIFLIEEDKQEWAKDMSELLLTIKRAVDEARAKKQSALDEAVMAEFSNRYIDIFRSGFEKNPPNPRTRKGRGGRTKQSTGYNVLVRLRDGIDAVLRFMHDFAVPFGNNQCEQDLRMMKLKQKINGTFRSRAGADEFCNIRSYACTARKQGHSVLNAIKVAMDGHPLHLVPGR